MAILRMLITLLLIALIASPFAAGFMLEKRYDAMLVHLNTVYGGKIKFTGKFNKGYLKSTATTQLDGGPGTNPITLEHTIQQGPIMFNFQGWGKVASYAPHGYGLGMVDTKFTGDIAQKLSDIYGGKEVYSIKTMVGFNGDTKTEFKNNPITTNLGKGVLTWQGITGTATANKDLTDLSASMVMPLFEYKETTPSGDEQSINIANINVDFDNSAAAQDTFNMTVASVKIQGGPDDQTTANNLTFSSTKTNAGNLMNVTINAGFAMLNLQGHEVGPFSLNMSTKNVDFKVLQQAMRTSDMQASEMGVPLPSGMNHELLLEFLKNKPGIDIKFNLKTKSGDLDVTTHVEAGGPNLTKLDASEIAPTININKKVQIADKLFYKLLMRYGTEQVHDKERIYFMNNKTSTTPNPYTIPADRLNVIVENWANTLVTKLKEQNFITEKDNVISIDFALANNEATINGSKKTKADINAIMPFLQVPIPNAPANMPTSTPKAPAATTVTPAAATPVVAPATPATTATPAPTTTLLPATPKAAMPAVAPMPTPSTPGVTTPITPAVTKEPS